MEKPRQHLVLVGGGHSHAIALKQFAHSRGDRLRITLVSDCENTPYSGMLPGFVAGFYRFEDCHIHLPALANAAGASFVCDRAIALDLTENCLHCASGRRLFFDGISLDIGSTPARNSVPGAAELAIPAKPVPEFLRAWTAIVDEVRSQPERPLTLGIVGGGAGGVELAFNVRSRLVRLLQDAGQPLTNLTLYLFHRGAELMSGHAPVVRQRLTRELYRLGVRVRLRETVTAVERADPSDGTSGLRVRGTSGETVGCDRLLWVTQASAPSWLEAAGLQTDDRGFVLVDGNLRSLSHPHVFAAGDVATMQGNPRPKAGVFAVRQGPPLTENLRRWGRNAPLQPYTPQSRYLALIGTGDGRAIAARGRWGLGPWRLCWWLKDWIDRRFMEPFENLDESD